jgi:hypothetical protein
VEVGLVAQAVLVQEMVVVVKPLQTYRSQRLQQVMGHAGGAAGVLGINAGVLKGLVIVKYSV